MNGQRGDTTSSEIFERRSQIRILRWQVVLLGGILVLIATAAVIAWLWTETGSDRQLRIEAIKTGFTVGFGLGGSLALLLAARRQWLQERAQAHQEYVAAINKAHQEHVAAAGEHDATERRITELYVKAVDQLGSAKAPVRLGGLHAIERLAQANPDHRQTVSDVICAYLRMPFTPPDEAGGHASGPPPTSDSALVESLTQDEEQARRREELQVRLTAQRILASHLRGHRHPDQNSPRDTFWAEIDLIDLTGAHLVDLDLQHCRVPTLQLNRATLTGESVFRGMTCSLAFIQSAAFTGHTDFRGATFTNDAWFEYSTFEDQVWFNTYESYNGTHFHGRASFKGVTFARRARFQHATFAASLDFSEIPEGAERVHLEGARMTNPKAKRKLPPQYRETWNPDRDSLIITRETCRGPRPPRQKREPDDQPAAHDE